MSWLLAGPHGTIFLQKGHAAVAIVNALRQIAIASSNAERWLLEGAKSCCHTAEAASEHVLGKND